MEVSSTRKLLSLVQPSDYNSLLMFHIGGNEVATHDPRRIRKDFRALGQLVRDAETEALFSSVILVEGSNIERNAWTESIHTLLHGWCHCQNYAGFASGMARHAGVRWEIQEFFSDGSLLEPL